MSRWTHKILLVLLIVLLVPGALEVVENLWHLCLKGHVAHAVDAGADHAPKGQEHGCNGTFHFCSCCQSLSSAVPIVVTLVSRPMPLRRARPETPPSYERPFLSLPEHPPRA